MHKKVKEIPVDRGASSRLRSAVKIAGIVAPIVLILAYFTAFCIINFAGLARFCDGDIYADMYVAKLMWTQKTLFPAGWVFGNQFYVFATPVFAALFYGLTGSMNLSMALATTAMTVLMLTTFWWMLRPFVDRRALLLGTALLVSSGMGLYIVYASEVQLFYILASYYASYTITLFVVFGDYLRVTAGRRSTLFSVSFFAALLLSFCTGMNSLRQTIVMIAPLLTLEGLRWLARVIKSRKLAGSLSPLRIIHVLCMTAANLMGYAVIRIISPAQITIFGEVNFVSLSQLGEHLSTALRALRSITGLKYLLPEQFSIWLGLFAVFLVLMVLFALFRLLRDRDRDSLALCILLCVLSILSVEATSIVLNISLRGIYLFVWYPLVALCGVLLARKLRRPYWQLPLTLLMAANLCVTYLPYAQQSISGSTDISDEVTQWLKDSDYDIIYGAWPSVFVLAAKTDGAVDAGAWIDSDLTILGYINPQNIYSAADNERAVYLVSNDNERADLLAHATKQGVELQLAASFWDGAWELYRSPIPLLHH